jgi:hypothetical protein
MIGLFVLAAVRAPGGAGLLFYEHLLQSVPFSLSLQQHPCTSRHFTLKNVCSVQLLHWYI